MAGGYELAAFLAFGGVRTDNDQDGAGTLGRAADIGDVGRPGVLLIEVRAALWLDDDDEDGLAGPRVVEGNDGVGGELRRDDVVQVGRAERASRSSGNGMLRVARTSSTAREGCCRISSSGALWVTVRVGIASR
jgi:hypothetical protein